MDHCFVSHLFMRTSNHAFFHSRIVFWIPLQSFSFSQVLLPWLILHLLSRTSFLSKLSMFQHTPVHLRWTVHVHQEACNCSFIFAIMFCYDCSVRCLLFVLCTLLRGNIEAHLCPSFMFRSLHFKHHALHCDAGSSGPSHPQLSTDHVAPSMASYLMVCCHFLSTLFGR